MREENVTTVYELIGMLARYPADMPVATAVIGERIAPLNDYADGSVDIDEFCHAPEINVGENTYNGKKYVRLEVALT